jgi:hypothetical protein
MVIGCHEQSSNSSKYATIKKIDAFDAFDDPQIGVEKKDDSNTTQDAII